MTERKKFEMTPTLKAQKANDENSVLLEKEMTVTIEGVRDISTAHGQKLVADVVNEKKEKYSVFLNAQSQNNLIDALGSNDEKWLGNKAVLKIENAPKPFESQKMIVAYPKK